MERRGWPAEQGRASAAGQSYHLLADGSGRAGSPPNLFGLHGGLRWRSAAADGCQRR